LSVHRTILIHGLSDDSEGAHPGTATNAPCSAGLEPHLLDVRDLLVQTLILKTISVNLRLIVLQLCYHVFQLLGSLLQVLLVDLEFLGNFWATLFGKDVLEFNIELLFLLDKNILLTDFLSFGNQTLLQGLDLLNKLIGLWVSALKLPPTMNIKWFLKFVIKELSFLLLLQVLLFEEEYLSA
jgi:hypothetical protein